jgi:hypothetical protein
MSPDVLAEPRMDELGGTSRGCAALLMDLRTSRPLGIWWEQVKAYASPSHSTTNRDRALESWQDPEGWNYFQY